MLSNQVIKKFSEGDENAFRVVYYHHYNYTFHIAKRLLKQRDDAEDVIAEVFIMIWKHRHIFDKSEGIKAYITTCVRNKCFNIIRNEGKRPNRVQKITKALYGEILVDPDKNFKILKKDVALEVIYDIADDLKGNMKDSFFLYYSDGASAVAIAERLNVTRQNVHYYLKEARKFIKERISRLPYKVIRENFN